MPTHLRHDAYLAISAPLLIPFLRALFINDNRAAEALAQRQRSVVDIDAAGG